MDTFIDVRWIPESESRVLANAGAKSKETVRGLSQSMRLGTLDFKLKRQIQIETAKRSILEFEVRNSSRNIVKTSQIEVLAVKGGHPMDHQASVFEQDELKSGAVTTGRLIVTGQDLKGSAFVVNFLGRGGKILLGGMH